MDGSYSSNISEILNDRKMFYKMLFTSEGSNEPEAYTLLDKVLNEEEKVLCDADCRDD